MSMRHHHAFAPGIPADEAPTSAWARTILLAWALVVVGIIASPGLLRTAPAAVAGEPAQLALDRVLLGAEAPGVAAVWR